MTATTPAPDADKPSASLDETLLAMDVVDTLRRRERLVRAELDDSERAEDLQAKLKAVYADQGMDVPDHIIEEGVRALREDRFVYKPRGGRLARRLAGLYVRRGLVAKWAAGILALAGAAGASLYFAVVAPKAALPARLAENHAVAYRSAESPEAKRLANDLLARGETALEADRTEAVREAITDLRELQETLRQEYTLRVVSRPGERSGVWRVPPNNPRGRNHYLIVEPVDTGGRTVTVKIRNEEDGSSAYVSKWGLRVDEATFNKVAADKQDDGMIENDRVGHKARGEHEPVYEIPTTGGTITEW